MPNGGEALNMILTSGDGEQGCRVFRSFEWHKKIFRQNFTKLQSILIALSRIFTKYNVTFKYILNTSRMFNKYFVIQRFLDHNLIFITTFRWNISICVTTLPRQNLPIWRSWIAMNKGTLNWNSFWMGIFWFSVQEEK